MEYTTRPYRKVYNTELELSFKTNEKIFNDSDKSQLKYLSQLTIAQKWIENIFHPPYSTMTIANESFTYRSRIRASVDKNLQRPNATFTFDTKIDLSLTTCLELTAPLTATEFNTINKLYPKEPLIQKTRLFYQDMLTNLVYSFDIYPDSDIIRIEIEFESERDKNNWIKPEWLEKIEIKEKPADKKLNTTIRQ